jgi:hypothetical protein
MLAADTPEAPDDLLVPEPAVRTGALIGYARVSTSGQLLDRQQHALADAGCLRVFADKLSGKTADRPELAACLDYLWPGDTLVVPSLDRLSRSLADLIAIVTTLRQLSKPSSSKTCRSDNWRSVTAHSEGIPNWRRPSRDTPCPQTPGHICEPSPR